MTHLQAHQQLKFGRKNMAYYRHVTNLKISLEI